MPEKAKHYRYVYDPSEFNPSLRIEANERVNEMQFENLNQRLERIEDSITRLERRLWLTVYGVAAAILVQAFQSLLTVAP